MTHRLFTVTLTDLGTYEVTVAASDAKEAAGIAETLSRVGPCTVTTLSNDVMDRAAHSRVEALSDPDHTKISCVTYCNYSNYVPYWR